MRESAKTSSRRAKEKKDPVRGERFDRVRILYGPLIHAISMKEWAVHLGQSDGDCYNWRRGHRPNGGVQRLAAMYELLRRFADPVKLASWVMTGEGEMPQPRQALPDAAMRPADPRSVLATAELEAQIATGTGSVSVGAAGPASSPDQARPLPMFLTVLLQGLREDVANGLLTPDEAQAILDGAKSKLPRGVMVTLGILIPSFQVLDRVAGLKRGLLVHIEEVQTSTDDRAASAHLD